MTQFFYTILTQPLLNALIWIYNILPFKDIGAAIIVLTIVIRLLLWPTFHRQLKSQKSMQQLQPKINEIKEKYKDNAQEQSRAIMALYKEHKINPFGSCLPLLVQFPILLALFNMFRQVFNGGVGGHLYNFVPDPGVINTMFLGLVDMGKPNYPLAIIAGLLQFVQSKMITPKNQGKQDTTAKIMSAQFTYMFPILTVIISISLPSGIALYWAVTTLFAVIQQYYIIKRDQKSQALKTA